MLNVRLSEETETRLKRISTKTHRTKTYYVEEALKSYLDAYEQDFLAIAHYEEKIHKGILKTSSLEEVMEELGFDKNELAD